jgi:hypothetical protein
MVIVPTRSSDETMCARARLLRLSFCVTAFCSEKSGLGIQGYFSLMSTMLIALTSKMSGLS